MNKGIASLKDNIAVFEAQQNELEQRYLDKFVVFYNGEFVGSFDTFDAAGREAVARFGDGPYLIRQVGFPTTLPMPASVAYMPIYANG